MQHVYAVPGEFRGTQASLQVLRERSAPVVENTNTKYFGDSQQRNWASASLLLYYFFGWLFFGCFFFFFSLSSPLHTSLFPHSQVSTCLGNPSSMHGARTSVPKGDPAMERRGPGGVTASWPCSHGQGPMCKYIIIWVLNQNVIFFHQGHS